MPRFTYLPVAVTLGTLLTLLIAGPASHAQSGLRVGLGYDFSKIKLNPLSNPFDFHLGSARWNVSYDVIKTASKVGLYGMAYYDYSPDLFNGGGVGVRAYSPSLTSRSPYYLSAGVGLYDPKSGSSKVGYKLGLGIETGPLFFTELSYTLFKEDNYKARPSIVFGVRL